MCLPLYLLMQNIRLPNEASLNTHCVSVSCTFLSFLPGQDAASPSSQHRVLHVGISPWWCRSLLTIHHSLVKLSHPGQPWGSPFRQSDRSLRRRDWWAHICSFQPSFQTGGRNGEGWTTVWVNSLIFPLVRFGGKNLLSVPYPYFPIIGKRGYSWKILFNKFFPWKSVYNKQNIRNWLSSFNL